MIVVFPWATLRLLDWSADRTASVSSYRYSFESKLVLKIEHYLDDVLSSAVKIGFKSAVDLDQCLACLPRGKEFIKAINDKAAARPIAQT